MNLVKDVTINEELFPTETNYTYKGNDTYQASFGHDDVVMAQMQIVFVMQTTQFRYLLENLESGNNQQESFYNPYGEMYNYASYNSYYNINEMLQEEQNSNLNRLNRF